MLTLALVAISTSAFSFKRGDMEVIKGNVNFVFEACNIHMTIDFSNTQVIEFDDELPAVTTNHGTIINYLTQLGGNNLKDWPDVQEELHEYAVENYNKMAKKAKCPSTMVEFKEQAKYEIYVRVDTLDTGNASAAPFACGQADPIKARRGGAIANGIVEITNLETGESVATLRMNFIKGAIINFKFFGQTMRLNSLFTHELLGYYFLGIEPVFNKKVTGPKAGNYKLIDWSKI